MVNQAAAAFADRRGNGDVDDCRRLRSWPRLSTVESRKLYRPLEQRRPRRERRLKDGDSLERRRLRHGTVQRDDEADDGGYAHGLELVEPNGSYPLDCWMCDVEYEQTTQTVPV